MSFRLRAPQSSTSSSKAKSGSSFSVKANFARNFNTVANENVEVNNTESEMVESEEVIFVINEKTGEIKEEKQMVSRKTPVKAGGGGLMKTSNAAPTVRKESAKIVSLSMKKQSMESFM